MELKVYAQRASQPSRVVIMFCKLNGIEFEEIEINLLKGQHKTLEFQEINPLGLVPVIGHGDFKLFESHAILVYLASAFPGVADHWYPADLQKRAKVQSVLDWHHSTLRHGSVMYTMHAKINPLFGLPLNPQVAAEGEKILSCALKTIETVWLTDSRPFLVGGDQPSIADLSLVCEIMQLELVDGSDQKRLLEPYKKVQKWIEDTKKATSAHFDDVHGVLYKFSAILRQKSTGEKIEA